MTMILTMLPGAIAVTSNSANFKGALHYFSTSASAGIWGQLVAAAYVKTELYVWKVNEILQWELGRFETFIV